MSEDHIQFMMVLSLAYICAELGFLGSNQSAHAVVFHSDFIGGSQSCLLVDNSFHNFGHVQP